MAIHPPLPTGPPGFKFTLRVLPFAMPLSTHFREAVPSGLESSPPGIPVLFYEKTVTYWSYWEGPLLGAVTLKPDLQPELDLARRQLALHDAEGIHVDQASDQIVVGMIGDIEKLCPELHPGFFDGMKGARDGGIQVVGRKTGSA